MADHIEFSSCPTCGALAQCIAGDPVTWRHHEPTQQREAGAVAHPANCRNQLRADGKPYPRSGCAVCKTGGMTGCPYERVPAQAASQEGENGAMEALRAIKLRLHFVGMPQEPMWNAGPTSASPRWLPDWRYEIDLIESALHGSPRRFESRPQDTVRRIDTTPAHPAADKALVTKVERTFRWDSERLQHVPQLLVEFQSVPAGEPNDAPGWTARDNLAAALDQEKGR